MIKSNFVLPSLSIFLLAVLLLLSPVLVFAADEECESSADYQFLCGMQNPEDLVRVPDTRWIIASSMRPGGGLYLIDSKKKTWSEINLGEKLQHRQDMALYGACPGVPVAENLITHGLHLRPGENRQSALYVVAHGARESIEVFEVDASAAEPALTWVGCLMSPGGMQLNSVTSLADGTLLATIPVIPKEGEAVPRLGDITGSAFRWSPGDSEFTAIEGTELPYPNGIEVSEDEKEFYIASSGLFKVLAFSNTSPARLLRQTEEFDILPDNLHSGDAGRLVTAGMVHADPVCGVVQQTDPLSLEVIVACARPFQALSVDPATMAVETLASGPANPHFSNVTMALSVAGELWIGTFAGDRVAHTKPREE